MSLSHSSFGVCCLFVVTGSNGMTTISQNCTYIQNENFPSAAPNTNAVQFTVQKCADGNFFLKNRFANKLVCNLQKHCHDPTDVCLLRLDFETFNIIGAGGTAIDNEGDCMDTFTVTVILCWNMWKK